ncbi:DUF6479 family protein [Streptomyces sp. NPDC002690]
MDVSNGAQAAASSTLAVSGALGTGLIIAAVAVVALLIGAFWFGMRRRDKELPPPRADEQPVPPDHRSHIQQENVHGEDRFPGDGTALSPYELGEHGTGTTPPESDRPRD